MQAVKTFVCLIGLLTISLQLIESATVFDSFFQKAAEEHKNDESKPVELPPNNAVFDFIIVGGGSSGCVLANRLSENPNWSVLLIEAGGNEDILNDTPALLLSVQKSYDDWQYQTTPQENGCFGMRNRKCSLPHGKVLGGSSATNYMFYTRGNRKDYDNWASQGNFGWSFAEVFKYFLRSEGANLKGLEDSPWHNRTGEQSVEFAGFRSEIAKSFVSGIQEAGHRYTDINGYSQLGVSFAQTTCKKGHRASSAKSFIRPIQAKRKNLKVINYSIAVKILIDPKTLTAYGVNYVHNNRTYTVRSRKETILSAGALHSPHLLMLSGVGPTENLQSVGIPQVHQLPVGQVLYDHICHFGPVFTTNTTGSTLFSNTITAKDVQNYQAGNTSTRVSSTGGLEVLAFIRKPNSKTAEGVPDIEIIMGAVSLASDKGTAFKESANYRDDIYEKSFKELENKEHFLTAPVRLHPISRGSLWLSDKNPFVPPKVNPNYLKEQEDVEVILRGIKEAIRISKSPSLQKINATLWERNVPGCEHLKFGTDDYWRCSIRVLSFNFYHYVGTCKMGPNSDPLAVVDPRLKVKGIRKLRVVDLSIAPTLTSGHTNAVGLMIAEKAADLIKQEWDPEFYG